MIRTLLYLSFLISLFSCNSKKPSSEYKTHPNGFYYKLLAYSDKDVPYVPGRILHLSLMFKTQSDSVFWDSDNNFNDQFYLTGDTSDSNFLHRYASGGSIGDSVCLLISPEDFFSQQYNSPVPFFSKNDSAVKIYYKIKRTLSPEEFELLNQKGEKEEVDLIRKFFPDQTAYEKARDPEGFYWIDRTTAANGQPVEMGRAITIRYSGRFLNGRFLDSSGRNFEFVYGTPDQVLTGINYAIGKLKIGENAKIILPSRLAFGEYGSTNGSVPPHTPLIYEIKIIQ